MRPLRSAAPALGLLAGLLFIACWFLQAQFDSHFTRVLGDINDSTIEVSILEHWFEVVRGLAPWKLTGYFHPHPATLGYNDGYLFYGLLYAIPRFAGIDPLLSAQLMHVGVRVLGAAAMYLMLRSVFGVRRPQALAGMLLFALANNMVIQSFHAQLLTLGFAPFCAWLLFRMALAFKATDARGFLRWACAFAVTYGLWAMTSFYMLWFFTFFMVLFGAIFLLQNRPAIALRPMLPALAAALALLALCLLPFLAVYLQKASETGMHDIGAVRAYLPHPLDIFNIGMSNYPYRSLLPSLHAWTGIPIDFSEMQTGFTPILLLAFLAAAVLAKGPVARATAWATLIAWLLCQDFGGHSAWELVYHVFPGAKAIRVVARLQLFLALPLIAVAMAWLSQWRGKAAALALVLCVLLVAEQRNASVEIAQIDRHAVMARLDAAKPVPAHCKSFFMLDTRPVAQDYDYWYRHNVDAMLAAPYLGIPTINGYSSFNPPDWKFDNRDQQAYLANVGAYAKAHHLEGLCSLDLEKHEWKPLTFQNVPL